MDSELPGDGEEYREAPPLPMVAISAVLAGCAVLVFAGIGLPYLLPRPPVALLFGAGVGTGLLLWFVALPLGLRHAALVWKLAGAAVLLAAGAGGAHIANRFYHAAAVGDASSFAEAEFGYEGSLALPRAAAGRGPVSQLHETLRRETEEERRDYFARLAKVNMGALNSPFALEQDPSVLADCGAIGALRPVLDARARKQAERAARLAAAVDASGMSDALRRGVKMMVAPEDGIGGIVEGQKALYDATEGFCRLLARRTWRNHMGLYGFTSQADLARFRALDERRVQAAGAANAAERDLRAKLSEGREIVREELSR